MRLHRWAPLPDSLFGDTPNSQQGFDSFLDVRGPEKRCDSRTLEQVISTVSLRGRGGAAFPTVRKLKAVRDAAETVKPIVVANGAESEPLSYKDRYLTRFRPHWIIEGVLLVSRALNAKRAYIVTEDEVSLARMEHAMRERGPDLDVVCSTVANRYVAGEETAVVSALNGGGGLPRDKPPRPFSAGVEDAPTLVLNVETFARIAMAAYRGGGASSGEAMLLTVSSIMKDPELYEIPFGTALDEIIASFGGERYKRAGALLGGFFGGLVPSIESLVVGHDSIGNTKASFGCGTVYVIDEESDCPIAVATEVTTFLARNNARQCGSCIAGTSASGRALKKLAAGTGSPGLIDDLARWSLTLPGRGACALPDGLARLLACLLADFSDQLAKHVNTKCPVCEELLRGSAQGRFSRDPSIFSDSTS